MLNIKNLEILVNLDDKNSEIVNGSYSPIWMFPLYLSPGTPAGYNPFAPHLSQFAPVSNPYNNPYWTYNYSINFQMKTEFLRSISERIG